MERASAKRLSTRIERSSKLLHETLGVAKESLSPREYKSFRRSLTGVMGLLYLDLLKPIYDEWPEIDRFSKQRRVRSERQKSR